MARLINSTRRPIALPTRHIVPAEGQLETTNEVICCTDNWPKVNGLVLSGDLVAELDPPPEAAEAPAPVVVEPAADHGDHIGDADKMVDHTASAKASRLKP